MENSTTKASGLTNVVNTVISPKEAFEALRVAPTWGWALVITIVVAMICSFLEIPALLHAFEAGWPAQVAANPKMAALSTDQLANIKHFSEISFHFSPLIALIFVPLFVLFEAFILWILNAIGKGSVGFKALWSVSANVAIPAAAIAAIVNLIIVLARGADSFTSMQSVQAAIPTLALLAPHAGKLTNFLGAFSPFTIWGAGLIVSAMLITARTNKTVAWIAGVLSILLPACFALLGPAAT
ncbi:MAG TPA: YIP1 family protein [Candidatus Baltobacteraceae bacterium]